MMIQSFPALISMGHVESAHSSLNSAYNAIKVDRKPATLPQDVTLARSYVTEARHELAPAAGHDGAEDATAAARAVLPRLDHALVLLTALGASRDPIHIAPLLDQIGLAMDCLETALAGVGWD